MSDDKHMSYLQVTLEDVIVSSWAAAANASDIMTNDRPMSGDGHAIDILIATLPERSAHSGGVNVLLADSSVRFDAASPYEHYAALDGGKSWAFDPQFIGGVAVAVGDIGDLNDWRANYGVGPAPIAAGDLSDWQTNFGTGGMASDPGDKVLSFGFDLM